MVGWFCVKYELWNMNWSYGNISTASLLSSVKNHRERREIRSDTKSWLSSICIINNRLTTASRAALLSCWVNDFNISTEFPPFACSYTQHQFLAISQSFRPLILTQNASHNKIQLHISKYILQTLLINHAVWCTCDYVLQIVLIMQVKSKALQWVLVYCIIGFVWLLF